MPNWNFVKPQLKFDKHWYQFMKTHKPKTKKTNALGQNNALFINLMEKKHHHNM